MTKQQGILVPLDLAQAIVNYLEEQPHKLVNGLLVGISQCQTMDVPEQEEKVDKTGEAQ